MRGILLSLALGSTCCLADPAETYAAPAATSRKVGPHAPPAAAAKVDATAEQAIDFAKTDPVRGLFWLEENDGYRVTTGSALVTSFVAELVKTDPQKAIELYDQFEPGENRSRYTDEVAKALTTKDLNTAWEAYAAKRQDAAARPIAGRIIAIHCGKGVEKAWNAYRSHEPEPDKKLFLQSICITPGDRATADTTFSLNMMRTVQNCAKCEAAFEVFVCNQDGKDIRLLSAYLAAHPKEKKFDPAYADLAHDRLKNKDPYEAAKWMSRMTCSREDLLTLLKNDLKNAPPKTQKTVAALVPEVLAQETPQTIKGDGP